MCGGVEAREADKVWKIYFPNPKAALPVLLEDSGQLDWITWGRRTEQPGYGPTGGVGEAQHCAVWRLGQVPPSPGFGHGAALHGEGRSAG
jgi:hypothetical protein